MNANFNPSQKTRPEAARDMDSLQRDRFELLSAYIDGEVTATERITVQEWLAKEPDIQRLYARLLKLRGGFHKLPVPTSQVTAPETAKQVFARIDSRRLRKAMVWGGGAIAAAFVGAFSGIFPGSQFALQQAKVTQPAVTSEPLMIAVNRPVIEIPKAAVSSTEKFGQPQTESGKVNRNNVN
ncbi:MAG TPA: Fis family transcriptional regulator [Cyanobacteria bacterium UBA11149]|nr:Fis family transcriptional regulator [Cyanobacteria bacterium UBA11367]HBE58202.1 Fis family transcriptional regulator [Cyanobacteria bacterium UBA11366]HBK66940.1 Fis family transcriptional regulator [Cyanobacteria bacterium UBA11166]HBS70727.1 Fis family transcriptional regulator [Cyanobacteria bacterium UBA11153]HBW88581.1 Fis family transcriptional regulator [Cyanobacteria bacterium UBA11149]HCA95858.1 Fis family transcriptional regulator [Cyanobacteria bacterium UBA9226]